ncbi:hypothetical protein E2320_013629, partial [Naja naja]
LLSINLANCKYESGESQRRRFPRAQNQSEGETPGGRLVFPPVRRMKPAGFSGGRGGLAFREEAGFRFCIPKEEKMLLPLLALQQCRNEPVLCNLGEESQWIPCRQRKGSGDSLGGVE